MDIKKMYKSHYYKQIKNNKNKWKLVDVEK